MNKVALACSQGKISEHFGFCEEFVIYEIETNKIKHKEKLENPGHIPEYLPKFLKTHNIDVIITGGIGPRAIQLFHSLGIKVITNASGNEEEVIKKYIRSQLEDISEPCKEHKR